MVLGQLQFAPRNESPPPKQLEIVRPLKDRRCLDCRILDPPTNPSTYFPETFPTQSELSPSVNRFSLLAGLAQSTTESKWAFDFVPTKHASARRRGRRGGRRHKAKRNVSKQPEVYKHGRISDFGRGFIALRTGDEYPLDKSPNILPKHDISLTIQPATVFAESVRHDWAPQIHMHSLLDRSFTADRHVGLVGQKVLPQFAELAPLQLSIIPPRTLEWPISLQDEPWYAPLSAYMSSPLTARSVPLCSDRCLSEICSTSSYVPSTHSSAIDERVNVLVELPSTATKDVAINTYALPHHPKRSKDTLLSTTITPELQYASIQHTLNEIPRSSPSSSSGPAAPLSPTSTDFEARWDKYNTETFDSAICVEPHAPWSKTDCQPPSTPQVGEGIYLLHLYPSTIEAPDPSNTRIASTQAPSHDSETLSHDPDLLPSPDYPLLHNCAIRSASKSSSSEHSWDKIELLHSAAGDAPLMRAVDEDVARGEGWIQTERGMREFTDTRGETVDDDWEVWTDDEGFWI